jgi:hypothetical protein
VGVGHASFTKSPDGTQDWIVYHAHANPTVFNEDRVVRIQPFTFFPDGSPNFGAPLPPGQAIPAPTGLSDEERVLVVGDYNADDSVNSLDYSVWRATFGTQLFPGSAADGNGSGVADAADYVLWRKAASVAAGPLADREDSTAPAVTNPQLTSAGPLSNSSVHAQSNSNTVIVLAPIVIDTVPEKTMWHATRGDWTPHDLILFEAVLASWPSTQLRERIRALADDFDNVDVANSRLHDDWGIQPERLESDVTSFSTRSAPLVSWTT